MKAPVKGASTEVLQRRAKAQAKAQLAAATNDVAQKIALLKEAVALDPDNKGYPVLLETFVDAAERASTAHAEAAGAEAADVEAADAEATDTEGVDAEDAATVHGTEATKADIPTAPQPKGTKAPRATKRTKAQPKPAKNTKSPVTFHAMD